jgi:hypothetical protein
LIYPEFNLLLQSDATNIHWSCDHLALAESQVDSTPAIIHAVINSVNAIDIEDYMKEQSCTPTRLNNKSERIVLKVQSPEDDSKEMDVAVDVFIVDQVTKINSNNPLKGQSYFDPSYVAGFDFSDKKILSKKAMHVDLKSIILHVTHLLHTIRY